MLSNIQWAHAKIQCEAAVPEECGFYGSSLFFFFCHLFCSIYSLLPSLCLRDSPFPPLLDHYIVVESYLYASLLILSTKGTLVNLHCLPLLIHNYSASHRRTTCTLLISSLFLPPLLMHKGLLI